MSLKKEQTEYIDPRVAELEAEIVRLKEFLVEQGIPAHVLIDEVHDHQG